VESWLEGYDVGEAFLGCGQGSMIGSSLSGSKGSLGSFGIACRDGVAWGAELGVWEGGLGSFRIYGLGWYYRRGLGPGVAGGRNTGSG